MKRAYSIAAIVAWCLYDWAAASFSIIVTTFIFATYFTTSVAENHVLGTYQWANAVALAGVIIAFASPLLGAIADYGGHHKRWLLCFTLLSVFSTAMLWFAFPNQHSIHLMLTCLVIGTIGFELSLVFYNSYLPQLAPREYLGRISGWGWGAGYLGGIIALTFALFVFVRGGTWLDRDTAEQVRICGPFVAVWYAMFSLPLFFLVPEVNSNSRPLPTAVKLGCRELWHTIKTLPQEKNIFIYLIAHMIYADGLNTLFAFGGIYAAGTYGLSFEQVLLFGITMNVAAGIGALLLGWIDDVLGSKPTIIFSLVCLTMAGATILFLHDKYIFWAVALFACLFVGPIQSASRSLMVHLIQDKPNTTEMFGLYSLSGRVTSFVGPWLLGMATITFQSQRVGIATILIFFVVGAVALLPVKVIKAEA
jgi:MFS transporter, UMF1 family